ncbi:MAG: hypothetical protein BWY21_00469 [Parcubacteria group bacterium ADurb.Bin216]|nr:MAG: hypothetical protein BWY21_00469 [Parcubacteria group bacterium ADurb.Bin216]
MVVSHISDPMMIREKILNVSILKGRVMILRIGFMKNSKTPNMSPAKRTVSSRPSETTPEMK